MDSLLLGIETGEGFIAYIERERERQFHRPEPAPMQRSMLLLRDHAIPEYGPPLLWSLHSVPDPCKKLLTTRVQHALHRAVHAVPECAQP